MDKHKKDKPIEENKKSEIEEIKEKCEEYLSGWKRERADFLNYKKEEGERIRSVSQYATEGMILGMISVLDNIYLAENHIPEKLKDDKWIEGFSHIKKQIEELLQQYGVEEILAKGEEFNPETMESVEEVPARNASHSDAGGEGEDSGKVAEEIQKGYKIGERIIRPSKVKITK